MTVTIPQDRIDPLRSFLDGAVVKGTGRPVPLVRTGFEVGIDGGLAMVVTRRTFRNGEAESIEATITFPVPVHATLFDLEARIDGRTVKARAQRKAAAVATYENAIEDGRTAILHEEVLRGVHRLSVGHIPPGGEIEITTSWAATLTSTGAAAILRIPLTVGDIYGPSPLSESDDIVHGGPLAMATLIVACRDGTVTLAGEPIAGEAVNVPLNAPIDLAVTGWASRDLVGLAADGRRVTLRIEPAATGEAPLDLAILADRSGSMAEIGSGLQLRFNKHQALAEGIASLAPFLRDGDGIDLWEFNDGLNHVGSTREAPPRKSIFSFGAKPTPIGVAQLAARMQEPAGGTEIGRAIAGVIAGGPAKDILLVTDGKSHAIDVQALARSGRRVSVVLVGEDSLEANVGHLAALTGGELFVTAGADVAAVLQSALRSLRTPAASAEPIVGRPTKIGVRRAGMTLAAEWTVSAEAVESSIETRAVAAMAASLALPAMETEAATQLAEAEGLVTHLTSLVLVDTAGAIQEGVPAQRKVLLPTPRTNLGHTLMSAPSPMMPGAATAPPPRADEPVAREMDSPRPNAFDHPGDRPTDEPVGSAPAGLANTIDWDAAPRRLRSGDLTTLAPHVADQIREAASDHEIVALARRLGIDPVLLVIGLLARAAAGHSRSADRVARAILGRQPVRGEEAAMRALGLGR